MRDFLAGVLVGGALAGGATSWLFRRRDLRLGRFIAYAAHELTTPITAVNMTLLNLLSGAFGAPREGQETWLEMMREQVGRLGGMIGELRDFMDLALGRPLTLHCEEMDAAEALEHALRWVRHGCAQAGVVLEVRVDKGLPKVRADADRLPRALGSLLLHARRFRSTGPLQAGVSAAKGGVEWWVEYAGAPLEPERARASLDLYYPALEGGGARLSASGLGLGVPAAVARRHGGELKYEVDGLGGARLSLLLPTRLP